MTCHMGLHADLSSAIHAKKKTLHYGGGSPNTWVRHCVRGQRLTQVFGDPRGPGHLETVAEAQNSPYFVSVI